MLNNNLIKNLIVAAVIFAGLLSLLVFVNSSLQKKITEFDEKIDALKTKQIKILNGNKLQTLAKLTEIDREVLDSYFLHEEEGAIEVLNVIELLAQKFNLKLKIDYLSLQKDENEEEEEGARGIKISLSGEGDYNRILNFVEALENLPFLSKLLQVELNKGDDIWKFKVVMMVMMI